MMNRPKKPTYKLEVGKAPHTSADMRFTCGRIVIKVSDAHPDARNLIRAMVGTRWDAVCKTVLAVWKSVPPVDPYVQLTEPGDWSLAAEVERMDNAKAAKAAKSGEGAEK